MNVWAVVYGNYEPVEIDYLFATRELAEARVAQLDGMWSVRQMEVMTCLDDPPAPPATSPNPASGAVTPAKGGE